MTSQTNELQAVVKRLERVENQNLRMKRMLLALLLIPIVMLVMGQARPPRTLSAQSFVLVDENGKKRGSWSVEGSATTLSFEDASGKTMVMLYAAGFGTYLAALQKPKGWEKLSETMAILKARAASIGVNGTDLYLKAEDGIVEGPFVKVELGEEGPAIHLQDAEGFSANIGSVATRKVATGETRKSSAASIILFGKDNKLLWSAP